MERPAGAPADLRYLTFLSLSGDGMARFEMDSPLPVEAPEEGQVVHLLRHARVAECNDLFGQFYGRAAADMTGLAMGEFVPADDPARLSGIREFIRAGYRLVYVEEEHALPGSITRWLSASALGAPEAGRLHEFWICLRDITNRKRSELDRDRRGLILEAVAFSAGRLLQPGAWRDHAQEVVARLGQAAQAGRAWLAEQQADRDGSTRLNFRNVWFASGQEVNPDDQRLREGLSLRDRGLDRFESELRQGRPIVARLGNLDGRERAFLNAMGSLAFTAVPIFADGRWWGLLGFGETRYEREWSGPEVEALKAAAALLSAALERERSDTALHESEERFRRLAAATFEGIDITEDGVILDANEQLAEMVGHPLERLIGRRSIELVPPESAAIVQTRLETFSEERYQHLIQRRDGSVFPAEVRSRLLPLGGRTVRISAVRDITERVEAEERRRVLEEDLRQAAEQWRQTFDALDLGIVLVDASGRILRLNRGALELLARHSFADALGLPIGALAAREPWKTAGELHQQVGESGSSAVAEARDDGGRAYYLLASPWARERGEPWRVITFRDVSDFTRLRQELRRARTLEAMGSLVAGVAHEVRNPLFSISATADALEAAVGDRSEFGEYTALLRSQVERLTQLMRDLLDYGKPSVLRPAPNHLEDMVRRAARACAGFARERRVALEEHLAPELPVLEVDAARFEQVLENLLVNALQHSPSGSKVWVKANLQGEGDAVFVRVCVEDEGPGVPPELLERVFEPFFTRRKGGTGLGLSIVQRIVEAHGGRIVAANREEGGARFEVRLPAPVPKPPDVHA